MIVPLTVAIVHLKASTLGSISVLASGASGLALFGEIGGIAAALVTVVAFVLGLFASNAKKRIDYQTEIRAAEQRGHDARDEEVAGMVRAHDDQVKGLVRDLKQSRSDMEFFRNQYAALLQQRAGAPAVDLPPLPTPPTIGDDAA